MTLCVLLAASSALADKIPTIKKLDDLEIQELNLGAPGRQCLMGNLNPPAYAITDWIIGNEGYKYLFWPPDYCQCPGFFLDTVHMYIQTDGPVNFDAYVDLEDAEWDDDTQCWVPGIVDCESPIYSIDIPSDGLWDIGLPMPEDNCDCAYMEYWYFIGFYFITELVADAVTDNIPVGCTSYNNFGSGWVDLVTTYGFPGELIMYADVHCCEEPVPAIPETWGGVKSLYR